MRSLFSKTVIATVVILVLIGAGIFVFVGQNKEKPETPVVEKPEETKQGYEVIGASVEKRDIVAYTYGNGNTHLLFVGGVHGGYEWNSTLLAYQLKDYLDQFPNTVPENVTVSIIPSLNPDGLYRVITKTGYFALSDAPATTKEIQENGRFNANEVDLNRNFDCNWEPTSKWRTKTVSAGSAPFSEPETRALRDYIQKYKPVAVIFWHSQANAVYASECNEGILPETLNIMDAYSRASGYQAIKSFDSYKVTGDAEGWLASINIPAITVEMKTHEDTEWSKNIAGIKALLKLYGDKSE